MGSGGIDRDGNGYPLRNDKRCCRPSSGYDQNESVHPEIPNFDKLDAS